MSTEVLSFYLNGKKCQGTPENLHETLLSFLRRNGLTGVKYGCGEGGCGACTVMLSVWDEEKQRPVHRAVNSCHTFVCKVHHCHVTTIEGLSQGTPNAIQQRMSQMHASQCGFCTPGIVMALYTLFRQHPKIKVAELEERFDGNLCRCTGYRPIIQAARSLCVDGTDPCRPATDSGLCGMGKDCCRNRPPADGAERTCTSVSCEGNAAEAVEFIFPPELARKPLVPLIVTKEGKAWAQMSSFKEAIEYKNLHPESRVMGGSSEATVLNHTRGIALPDCILDLSRVQELKKIWVDTITIDEMVARDSREGRVSEVEKTRDEVADKRNILHIGGAATLQELLEWSIHYSENGPSKDRRATEVLRGALTFFAGMQVRSAATVAGNVENASPISDLIPVLRVLGATVVLSCSEGKRVLLVSDHVTGYKKTTTQPNEIIERIDVPLTFSPLEFAFFYKQGTRRTDEIAIVTGAFRCELEGSCEEYTIAAFSCEFGGMAPVCVNSPSVCSYLRQKPFTADTMRRAFPLFEKDISLKPEAPGGRVEFRMTLLPSLLFKFFAAVVDTLMAHSLLPERERSACRSYITEKKQSLIGILEYPKPTGGLLKTEFSGGKDFTPSSEVTRAPVGEGIKHGSAEIQVKGDAVYCDDLAMPAGTLHCALILSSVPRGILRSIDTSAATIIPGVEGVFTAKDIPGGNEWCFLPYAKEYIMVPVGGEVMFVGQILGIVAASTPELARNAVKSVKIEIEPLPAIFSVKEAIEQSSFWHSTQHVVSGDVEETLKNCDHIVEGEMGIGGQVHFQLECFACVASPSEGTLKVVSCTQSPSYVQRALAMALKIDQNRVTSSVKRLGGAFGGKESRSIGPSVVVGIAAHLLGRPVRYASTRTEDTLLTGQRHPFLVKYKIGCDKSGKLQAFKADLYGNGGGTLDLSWIVVKRAVLHALNSYEIPNVALTGVVCKTNLPSNTAFRGFGAPQGMLACDTAIEQLAEASGIPVDVIRRRSLLQVGAPTHYMQTYDGISLEKIYDEAVEETNYEQRRKSCDEFNLANRWRKRGLAIVPTTYGIGVAPYNKGAALVHVYADGTVRVSVSGVEMGQGLFTKAAQTAARELQRPVESIYVDEQNTEKTSNNPTTAGSMGTDIVCMAVLNACERINAAMQPVRESMAPGASWQDIVRQSLMENRNLSAYGYYRGDISFGWDLDKPKPDGKDRQYIYFVSGIGVNEVEIDILTGETRIIRADLYMDLGFSINPSIDIGQIEGAYAQGMGMSTMEEVIRGDREHPWIAPGATMCGPGFYKIPTADDMPTDLRVKLLAKPNARAIHSSRAVGEPPLYMGCSVYFAIRDAVRSARKDANLTGTFSFHSPATPERIRMACQDEFTDTKRPSDPSWVPPASV